MGDAKEQLTTKLESSQQADVLNNLDLMDAVNDNIEWCQPVVMDSGDFHQYGWSRLTSAHGGLVFYRVHHANSSSKYAASIHIDYLEHYKDRLFCLQRPEDAYMVKCLIDAIGARGKACEQEAVHA